MQTQSGQPLAIIAGGGHVPAIVAAAAIDAGRPVLILGLTGEADAEIEGFPHEWVKWGQMARADALIRAHGADEIVLVGSINRRPEFKNIRLDSLALKSLPRLLSIVVGGDETVLTGAVRMIEERGFRIVGAHTIATNLVAEAGCLTRRKPSAEQRRDVDLAIKAARAIGRLDAGQATVAAGGRVVALEGAEGTDAMLARVVELREAKRISWRGRAGVLAKCAKPQQDLRVDMPTVGSRTVERAAEAGLAGIAIEAGKVMLVDRDETVAAAEQAGLFLVAEGAAAVGGDN